MNKHGSENTKNYKCDESRAVELIDLANDVALCGHRSLNLLNSLLWEQEGSLKTILS
jgi:hypothetical protein